MNDPRAHVSALIPSTNRSRLSLSIALALATMGGSALAQGAPAPDGAASQAAAAKSDEAQSVTITATRRREPAREVPMQVDVLSAEQLQAEGAKTLTDYLANQPGVNVKTDGGAGKGAVSVRGVSTGDQTIATVSTYIDDVAFGSSSAYLLGETTALDLSLLDLNHVELLRGPQGTLYGASSEAGTLRIITNQPDPGRFAAGYDLQGNSVAHGGLGYTAEGYVNQPITQNR